MKLRNKVANTFDRTIGTTAVLGGVLLIFVMLAICAEILQRLILGYSIEGVIEVTEYSLLYLTFLATAWVLKREGHVRMDLLVNRLSPGGQFVLNSITSIVAAFICLVIVWYGVKVTLDCLQIGYFFPKVLKIPAYSIVVIVPIGSFLLFIQFLRRTYGYLRDWKESKEQGTS